MYHPKILVRTLFVFILLAGLSVGIFLSSLASAYAAPQQTLMPGDVVISEFRTTGPKGGNDEFIELFNRTGGNIDLSGWEVKALTSTGVETTKLTISNGKMLSPGQHYLVANTNASGGYSGSTIPDQTYGNGIIDTGGIAIFDQNGIKIDSVGMNSSSIYAEGTFLSPMISSTVDQSYERKPGGMSGSCQDIKNNQNDFSLISPSNPQNMSSPFTYCAGVSTFTPTNTPRNTPTNTATFTPTPTLTSTSTTTFTPTNTSTSTPTQTATSTQTISPTITNTPIITFTSTVTPTPTACLGSTIIQWTFNGNVTTPSIGSGKLLASPSLPVPTFPTSVSANPPAISFSGWPSSLDKTHYVELDINTLGKSSIALSFTSSRSSTGPQNLEIDYSTDGVNFIAFQSTIINTNETTYNFDLSGISSLNNNPNAAFRMHGYSASSSSGTLRLDNVTLTGKCINPFNTPTSTSEPIYSPLSLVINEVGWMGIAANSNDEWVEFYNPGSSNINLSGWDLNGVNVHYTSGNFTIPLSGTVPAGSYFVVAENNQVFQNVTINQTSSSLSLLNSYQTLQLISPSDTLVDTANYSGNDNWPAGSTSPNYASMERSGVVPDGPAAWVTFAGPVTNAPLDRNGNHVYGTPGRANWAWTVTVTPSPLPTATIKPTPTFAPTPVPAVVLNEILARPGSDWNGDGTVNNYDEFIEVENLGPGIVDLSNWKLDVMPNGGSSPFTVPSRKLNLNERVVFFGSTTHLLLEDSGDTVRLIDSLGVIEDAFTYPAVLQPDDSWCRTRDGIGFWRDGCFPTPEIENALSGILPPPPPPQPGGEAACQLPDVAPSEFRLAECNGSGANIWNQKYWNDLSGQNEYAVPDPNSKSETYIQ